MQFIIKKFEKDILTYKTFEDRCRDMERDNGSLSK